MPLPTASLTLPLMPPLAAVTAGAADAAPTVPIAIGAIHPAITAMAAAMVTRPRRPPDLPALTFRPSRIAAPPILAQFEAFGLGFPVKSPEIIGTLERI